MTLLKYAVGPGLLDSLVLALVIGFIVSYVWPRHRRLGHTWMLSVIAASVIFGLPVVATAIAVRLPLAVSRMARPSDKVDVLVVLDGDNRNGRVREAMTVYASAQPAVVWALGEPWLVNALLGAGIAANRIAHDDRQPNTRAQMTRVAELRAENATRTIGVIASRLQMPRVIALASAQHLDVALFPSPADVEAPTTGAGRFIPSYAALRLSRDAIYEHAALAYYRWRGWIGQ